MEPSRPRRNLICIEQESLGKEFRTRRGPRVRKLTKRSTKRGDLTVLASNSYSQHDTFSVIVKAPPGQRDYQSDLPQVKNPDTKNDSITRRGHPTGIIFWTLTPRVRGGDLRLT